jgi:hypothetical protein
MARLWVLEDDGLFGVGDGGLGLADRVAVVALGLGVLRRLQPRVDFFPPAASVGALASGGRGSRKQSSTIGVARRERLARALNGWRLLGRRSQRLETADSGTQRLIRQADNPSKIVHSSNASSSPSGTESRTFAAARSKL